MDENDKTYSQINRIHSKKNLKMIKCHLFTGK